MKHFIVLLLTCFFMTGCITLGPDAQIEPLVEDEEPETIRLTQEKIEEDEGVQYIIVTFPKQSVDHDGFLDEDTGEYIVIGVLPSFGEMERADP